MDSKISTEVSADEIPEGFTAADPNNPSAAAARVSERRAFEEVIFPKFLFLSYINLFSVFCGAFIGFLCRTEIKAINKREAEEVYNYEGYK